MCELSEEGVRETCICVSKGGREEIETKKG